MMQRAAASLVFVLFAGSMLVATVGCSSSDTVPDTPAAEDPDEPRQVVLYQYQFEPDTVEIRPGTTVVFQNRDPEMHNVNIPALDIDEDIAPNEEWSHTFETHGEFAVGNRLSEGMRLDLTVEDGDGEGDE